MDDKTIIRIKGEWFEADLIQEAKDIIGQRYLDYSGEYVHKCGSDEEFSGKRHPLTPCSAPKAYTLVEQVLEKIGPDAKPAAYGSMDPGERFNLHSDRNSYGILSDAGNEGDAAVIVFETPPPEPEPEPKTAEELLADIVRTHQNGNGSSEYMAFTDAIEAGRKYGEKKTD